MNNRRDVQVERQQFGRHNAEYNGERDDGIAEKAGEPISMQGAGDQEVWRGDGQHSGLVHYGSDDRERENEGLSSDFSLEGTRNFSRDERRSRPH